MSGSAPNRRGSQQTRCVRSFARTDRALGVRQEHREHQAHRAQQGRQAEEAPRVHRAPQAVRDQQGRPACQAVKGHPETPGARQCLWTSRALHLLHHQRRPELCESGNVRHHMGQQRFQLPTGDHHRHLHRLHQLL
jgi:hypothetical protein